MRGDGRGWWSAPRPSEQVTRQEGFRQVKAFKTFPEVQSPTDPGATFRSRVFNPSSRIDCTVEMFWTKIRCTNAAQVADIGANGILLSSVSNQCRLTAYSDGPPSPPESTLIVTGGGVLFGRQGAGQLHDVLETDTPVSYTFDGSVKVLEVLQEVSVPQVLAADVWITWMLRALWEPNVPMTDEELKVLFAECQLE